MTDNLSGAYDELVEELDAALHELARSWRAEGGDGRLRSAVARVVALRRLPAAIARVVRLVEEIDEAERARSTMNLIGLTAVAAIVTGVVQRGASADVVQKLGDAWAESLSGALGGDDLVARRARYESEKARLGGAPQ